MMQQFAQSFAYWIYIVLGLYIGMIGAVIAFPELFRYASYFVIGIPALLAWLTMEE